VQRELLPRLEEAKLKVIIDFRDFDLGVPSVINMERAVDEARHTLVILTPAWVDSQWTEFESLLVSTGDPAGRRRRLVPVMLKRCARVPKRIAFLTYADLTDPGRFEDEMGRLLRTLTGNSALQSIRPLFNENIVQSARDGIGALSEVLIVSAVRGAMIKFKTAFQVARDQINILTKYKNIHDLLHTLQFQCYGLIAQEIKRFPEPDSLTNLQDHQLTFLDMVDSLDEAARRQPWIADETVWIQDLICAGKVLQEALENFDAGRLRLASRLINKVLAVQPSRINMRLDCATKNLNLHILGKALATICDKGRELGFDAETLHRFEDGAEAFNGLSQGLTALAEDHDQWQAVDVELRRIESLMEWDTVELEVSWPALKVMVEQLCSRNSDNWSVKLKAAGEQLGQSISVREPVKMKDSFRRFRRRAGEHFYRVDLTLKDLCEELLKVGDPLALVLGMIS
jgi:hypothetical protein